METLLKDIRYTIRDLIKHPGFSVIAIVTLALGIGANTAIFSVVNAVLLRPLPFYEAERLTMVWEDASSIGFPFGDPAPGTYQDWKERNTVFEGMAALNPEIFNLTGQGEPERIFSYGITSNLFPLLGVQPGLGRNFTTDEDKPGGPKVTILSNGLWQRRFGGDEAILGRDLLLNGEKYTVIGVMPPNFQFLQGQVGLWVPSAFTAEQLEDHDNHYLQVVARLKPNITLEQAEAEIKTLTHQIVQENPNEMANVGSRVMLLREQLTGKIRQPLLLLLVAVGFVLLIACANISGLLLSRAASRRREFALRTALGASRGRVLRQLLTESILLAIVGGLAGLLVAVWSFRLLQELIPIGLRDAVNLSIDSQVLAYSMLASIITGLLFGMVPALQASKIDLNEALKQGGRGLSASGKRTRAVFIVAQIALALVLLIGAGLMMQTVFFLQHQYASFQPERLLTLRTALPQHKYGEAHQRVAFYDQVLERVGALPGVISAAYATAVPLQWKGGANGFFIEGRPETPGTVPNAIHRQVSAGYFQTMGIELRQGRHFAAGDNRQSIPVAMVNEALARQYFPGEEAVGKRFKLGVPNAPWVTIIGIVNDVRQMGMDVPVKAEMYFPYTQITTHFWYAPRDLVIRTSGDPLSLVPAVRQHIHAVDADQPVSNIATMEKLLVEQTGTRRLGMILLSAFSGLALLLSALGIYGVLSYFVSQQTSEIGVRMALGAQRRNILGLVLKKGLVMTLIGVAIGLGAALALTRLMASLLFGVSARDPLTFAVLALVLTVVALLACYLPARRATKVDPLVALRYE